MPTDADFLLQAIELSRRCPPSTKAFSVGAVIVVGSAVIATGYSRETDDSVHAEEVALRRALDQGIDLRDATLYSSVEPCSVRLSGKTPCVERIVNCGIRRVVFALREPPTFVTCRGCETLRERGVEVLVLEDYADEVARINEHLLAPGGRIPP